MGNRSNSNLLNALGQLRIVVPILISALVFLAGACASSGDDEISSGGAEVAGSCEQIRFLLHLPVVSPAEEPELSDAEGARMMREIAESASGEDAGPLTELADYFDRFVEDPDALGPDDATRMTELFSEVNELAVRVCPPIEPVWGCPAPSRFEPIGDSIGEQFDPDAIAQSSVGAASPEEAVVDVDDLGLERVEASREDGEVVYAWVDEAQVAQKSVRVIERDDSWHTTTTTQCD